MCNLYLCTLTQKANYKLSSANATCERKRTCIINMVAAFTIAQEEREGGGGRQGGCLAGWQLLPFVCFVSRLPKMESRLSGGGQVIAIVISQRSKSNCLHCLACLPKMHTHTGTHTCNTPHNTDYTLPTLEHCLDARYTCALFAC